MTCLSGPFHVPLELATDDEPSHTVTPQQAVRDMLGLIVEVPFPCAPRIWRIDCEASGVFGIERAIRDWADANSERVYVESSEYRVEVIRRRDHRSLMVFRRDYPNPEREP